MTNAAGPTTSSPCPASDQHARRSVSSAIHCANAGLHAHATAAFWIRCGIVEERLLIAAEECDWLSAEALTHYHPQLIATEGAGALLLSSKPQGPHVNKVVGPLCYTSWSERAGLLPQLAAQAAAGTAPDAILIDDRTGTARDDAAEASAWSARPWNDTRSPKSTLGEAMGAGAALQLVLATLETRGTGRQPVVSMPGTNTAAYACVITPA